MCYLGNSGMYLAFLSHGKYHNLRMGISMAHIYLMRVFFLK